MIGIRYMADVTTSAEPLWRAVICAHTDVIRKSDIMKVWMGTDKEQIRPWPGQLHDAVFGDP